MARIVLDRTELAGRPIRLLGVRVVLQMPAVLRRPPC
jgi:hypothetical protein